MRRRRRPTTVGNDPRHGWRTAIADSRVFFVLLSPAYLRSPLLWQHLAYARALGKPVRVAVVEGAQVPDGLFRGIADLEIRHCGTVEEVGAYMHECAGLDDESRPGKG